MTKYYYRIDGRSPSRIMPNKPKTQEEVDKIKNIREREQWMKISGDDDKLNLRAYLLHKKELKGALLE